MTSKIKNVFQKTLFCRFSVILWFSSTMALMVTDVAFQAFQVFDSDLSIICVNQAQLAQISNHPVNALARCSDHQTNICLR